MPDSIDKAIEKLADAKAAWVHRRDAAEFLGKAGQRAVEALVAHTKDPDRDVQAEVQKALDHAAEGLGGVPAEAERKTHSLEELARACQKTGQRTLRQEGEGYVIRVQLTKDRHQDVHLMSFQRKDGKRIVRVFTYCGAPHEENLRWALKANMKIPQGGLGLMGDTGAERLVLVHCLHADEATPGHVKTIVKAIAAYGDWIEHEVTGLDEF